MAILAQTIMQHTLFTASSFTDAHLQDFILFVTTAMPFGDLIYDSVLLAHSLRDMVQLLPKGDTFKQPAWRPVALSGTKPAVFFYVCDSLQITRTRTSHSIIGHSSVECDSLLDGVPDISLSIPDSTMMQDISVSPCVQSLDPQGQGVYMFFCPFHWRFPLCLFRIRQELVDDFSGAVTCAYRCVPMQDGFVLLELQLRLSPPAGFATGCTIESADISFSFPDMESLSIQRSECRQGKLVCDGNLRWTGLTKAPFRKVDIAFSAVMSISTKSERLAVVLADSFASLRMKIVDASISQVKLGAFSVYPDAQTEPKLSPELVLDKCIFMNSWAGDM